MRRSRAMPPETAVPSNPPRPERTQFDAPIKRRGPGQPNSAFPRRHELCKPDYPEPCPELENSRPVGTDPRRVTAATSSRPWTSLAGTNLLELVRGCFFARGRGRVRRTPQIHCSVHDGSLSPRRSPASSNARPLPPAGVSRVHDPTTAAARCARRTSHLPHGSAADASANGICASKLQGNMGPQRSLLVTAGPRRRPGAPRSKALPGRLQKPSPGPRCSRPVATDLRTAVCARGSPPPAPGWPCPGSIS